MSKSWRRDFLVTLFLVAAGLGTVQAQEQSGTNNDALGPDYQQGKSALVAEKYEDAIKAFKRANKAQNEACSDGRSEWGVEQHGKGAGTR